MRRALELAPASPHVHFVAALGALLQGNPDGAIAECHKALELDPNNFGAHVTLAAALNWQKKYDEGAQKRVKPCAWRPGVPTLIPCWVGR